MGGIWTPLSLTKHALFVLFMYRGHPNIWGVQAYGQHPNMQAPKCMGVSRDTGRHMGGIQRYRGYANIWEHPNVWGHMNTPLVWQSMLSLYCGCTGGIQTFFCIILNYICHLFFFNFKYFIHFSKYSFEFCTVCSETTENIAKLVCWYSLLQCVQYIVL